MYSNTEGKTFVWETTKRGKDRNYFIRWYTFPVHHSLIPSECLTPRASSLTFVSRSLTPGGNCLVFLDLRRLSVHSNLGLGRGQLGVCSRVRTHCGTKIRTLSCTLCPGFGTNLWTVCFDTLLFIKRIP